MAISRSDALKRIAGLSQRVEEHLARMQSDPLSIAYNHWKSEARIFIDQIEALARHVGRRTGEEVLSRVAQWKEITGERDA